MIIVLTGTNDFARLAALRQLMADFADAHSDFGIEQIDAGQVDFGRLLETVASLPFLTTRSMVIVHDLNANKTIVENIEQLLDSVADTTDLVFVEPKFDKRLSVYKTLKKRTDFREFTELDERGLSAWLVQKAAERGGVIKPNDASMLVDRAGTNQMGLSHELDKLLSLDPEVTKSSIELLVEPLPRSSVFDLLDAAFQGQKQRALELYQDQRKQQLEPQYIMGMIAWQVHNMAVVKFNEKDGANAIAKQAKLNPYVVRKTLNLTRNLTKLQMKKLVARTLQFDIRLKTEMIDADDAVQHFLLTI